VATTRDFAAGSIVLDKPALTESRYVLTTAEAEALAGDEDTTYYWRIQASDAASNLSPWVIAADFSYSPPFNFFSSMFFYIALAVGGILLFALGFLLGKKMAYSW
jgi:hypothetical protein